MHPDYLGSFYGSELDAFARELGVRPPYRLFPTPRPHNHKTKQQTARKRKNKMKAASRRKNR